MKILIFNNAVCHYEIIESVIAKYYQLLRIKEQEINNLTFLIHIINSHFKNVAQEFRNYILKKYKNVSFITIDNNHISQGHLVENFITESGIDYIIDTTIYPNHKNIFNNPKIAYISHSTESCYYSDIDNVFYLAPFKNNNFFSASILPFAENKKMNSKIPIYCVQGSFPRRSIAMLKALLSIDYKYDFRIKIIGNSCNSLNKINSDKIILRSNLSWNDYHKEFLDCYCLIPLINKKEHPHYYNNKLTSSINYILGYGLKCLIDRDLQDIYNLPDATIFNDINDISEKFLNTLEEFYTLNSYHPVK